MNNRNKLIVILFLFSFTACQTSVKENPAAGWVYYGDSIGPDGSSGVSEIIKGLESKDSVFIKFRGLATESCQKKGCWMDVLLPDSSTMKIRFKDYGFFVPKDLSNDSIVAEGWAYRDTISVEELRHYAQDAGKPDSVIDLIVEPEWQYRFEANGVLVKK